MKSTPENKFRCCSHCHQTLPIEEFYIVNKRTGKRDAYCKTCRRLMNRLRQHPDEQPAPEARPRRRTLICEETDPERRMQLILQACSVVRESVMRKRMRMREEEGEEK